jgi:DNA-binding PadR family transcriptional regulator
MPVANKAMTNKAMTDTSARDLFPGALEMMIVESHIRERAHGYALVQHIQHRSNNLLKAKLVKAEWKLSSTNRRVRTYQITAAGLRRLDLRRWICAAETSRFPASGAYLKVSHWS